jgi:hypothetical protein
VVVAVDRESHAAAQHEVDLLVTEPAFRVFLHDLPARTRRVRVRAERLDPEVPPDGPPGEPLRHLDLVELVDVDELHASSCSNRGSSRS